MSTLQKGHELRVLPMRTECFLSWAWWWVQRGILGFSSCYMVFGVRLKLWKGLSFQIKHAHCFGKEFYEQLWFVRHLYEATLLKEWAGSSQPFIDREKHRSFLFLRWIQNSKSGHDSSGLFCGWLGDIISVVQHSLRNDDISSSISTSLPFSITWEAFTFDSNPRTLKCWQKTTTEVYIMCMCNNEHIHIRDM